MKNRFYLLMTVVVVGVALGFAVPMMFIIGRVLFVLLMVATLADAVLLYSKMGGSTSATGRRIQAFREVSPRFSNGDDNPVSIRVESNYAFAVGIEVIDEIPFVFQRRDICFRATMGRQGQTTFTYHLRPTTRGTYGFGHVRVFVSTALGLVERRFTCCEPQEVKVYPSYLMLRQYELLAMSNNLTEMGIKRVRHIGHNTDFEQIKDYVVGDDYRSINWRATARRHALMVNVYQEERSQPVYSVIDKGRMMQQAFHGMTLLDYSINAALVLSYVAVNKQDKAGLVTFSEKFETCVPASRQGGQMQVLQEALYAENTRFGETDFSALVAGLVHHVRQRSLLILYTSFTTMPALRRQLPFLRQVAMRHRLLVVFFEDEELRTITDCSPSSIESGRPSAKGLESYYQYVIAEKFLYEQRLIVHTLRQYGIQTILTTPQNLSVDVINKYLEMKARF